MPTTEKSLLISSIFDFLPFGSKTDTPAPLNSTYDESASDCEWLPKSSECTEFCLFKRHGNQFVWLECTQMAAAQTATRPAINHNAHTHTHIRGEIDLFAKCGVVAEYGETAYVPILLNLDQNI